MTSVDARWTWGGLAHLPPHVQWTIETGEVDLVNILHGILAIIGVLDDEV